jgi:hypothetical protein
MVLPTLVPRIDRRGVHDDRLRFRLDLFGID